MGAADLRLRPVRLPDEAAAVAAHEQMEGEGYSFLLGYSPGEPWTGYVDRLTDRSRGLHLPADGVPAAFLLATAGDALVGRVSVRFGLNDYLALAGGHIGYCVVPHHRRRGYATEMLRQGLVVARARGVDDVLVTCAVDNRASAAVIERCGGVFDAIVDDPLERVRKRRYWIH